MERTGHEYRATSATVRSGPPFTTTLERMERRATYLSLGLVGLSLALLLGGRYLAIEPGWQSFRMLGFILGGMLSVVTFVLCIYYLRFGRVRTVGIKIATAATALYSVAFIAFFASIITGHPSAANWAGYAF